MSLKNGFLALLAFLVVVLANGSKAQEREHCSNATLHGSYGLHATGTVPGVFPSPLSAGSHSMEREI
jgi:hypothetical protein